MIRAEDAVDVRADPDTAFAYLSSIEHYPDWLPGVVAAEQTSEGPLAVGTTFVVRIAGPTGPVDAAGEVTNVDAPRSLGVRAEGGPARVVGGFELQPTDGGTQIRVWIEIELLGAYQFAEGLVRRELDGSLPAVLARLRASLDG